jgi:hypothetical protein
MKRQRKTKATTAAAIALIAAAALCPPGRAHATGSEAGMLDGTPPAGAVGGVQSPIDTGGTLNLLLQATDNGAGLAAAEASVDGVASVFVRLGTGSCPERPAANNQALGELPVAGCPESVSGVHVPINVGATPGSRRLQVSVTDAAGNTTTLVDQTIVVQSPTLPGASTVTVGIGNPGSSPASTAVGGVQGIFYSVTPGGKSVACQLPALSMRLASKPLRYAKHHVPVLLSRRPYVFRGRLTCLLHNRRVSAPTGTVLRVFVKVGRRTYNSGRGTMIVHNGNLRAILAYWNSRTIFFRYRPGNGEFVQATIRVKVVRHDARKGIRR